LVRVLAMIFIEHSTHVKAFKASRQAVAPWWP
jgi:hypothetical protein